MSTRTIKERIKYIARNTFLIAFLSYIGFFGVSSCVSEYKYPVLEDESKIEKIIKREVKKLNLENKKIVFDIVDYRVFLVPAETKIFADGSYLVELRKGLISEGNIKHELYHIYKGDKGGLLSLKFWLIEEPRAILYEAYDIKLSSF